MITEINLKEPGDEDVSGLELSRGEGATHAKRLHKLRPGTNNAYRRPYQRCSRDILGLRISIGDTATILEPNRETLPRLTVRRKVVVADVTYTYRRVFICVYVCRQ